MTACVNNTEKKAKGGVFQSKVLRAAMAGVLAIGLMPFTHGQALAATDNAVFEEAKATYTTEESSLTYTGQPAAMGVQSIVDKYTGTEYEAETDYLVRYFKDVDLNGVLSDRDVQYGNGKTAPSEVGNYLIVAMTNDAATQWGSADPTYTNVSGLVKATGKITKAFSIVPNSLDGAYAYEVGDNAENTADTTFTYNTQALKVGFAINGKAIDTADYDVSYVFNGAPTNEVKNAGEYTATLVGKNGYDNKAVEVKFTVEKLDLSTATFYTPDTKAGEAFSTGNWATETSINGDTACNPLSLAGDAGVAPMTYTSGDGTVYGPTTPGFKDIRTENGGNLAPKYTGAYVMRITAYDGNKNVTGTADYTMHVVADVVKSADVFYGADRFKAALDGKTFYGTDWAFDASKIAVKKADGTYYTVGTDYAVTITDANGKPVDAISAAGQYTVTVAMNVAANHLIGGSVQATFTYFAGKVDGATTDIVAIVNGKNVEPNATAKTTYDAEAVVPSITVKCGDETLAEGTDYTVEYTKDGKVVDEMVDAGTYTVTVKSDFYQVTDGVFYVEIGQLDPVSIKANTGFDELNYYAYTGEVIEPTFIAYDAQGKAYELTADDIASINYDVRNAAANTWDAIEADEIVDIDRYQATLTLKGNFTGTETCDFYVDRTVGFEDNLVSQWYAEEVYDAGQAGYMNGYAGTSLFGPDNNIMRGEVACVLFNVASKGGFADIDSWINNTATTSAFADVAVGEFWTNPINWASSTGVVNGYGDGENFGPADQITREQFASMLANYAKATKDYVAPTTDISGMPGADGVSGWALENVQWAVENGIMGNNGADLNAQGYITRAEVAAMVMNFTEKF